MVDFKTRDEVLRHFMDDGDLLDTASGTVFIADCNADGEFFGIMVAGVPEEHRGSIAEAVEYALETFPAPGTGAPNRMQFMEAPGHWFGKVADIVVEEPERFVARSYRN